MPGKTFCSRSPHDGSSERPAETVLDHARGMTSRPGHGRAREGCTVVVPPAQKGNPHGKEEREERREAGQAPRREENAGPQGAQKRSLLVRPGLRPDLPRLNARPSLPEKTTARPKDAPPITRPLLIGCRRSRYRQTHNPFPSTPGERFHDVAESPLPFRLESVADADALYGQSRKMRHRWLVLCAHENVPVKPQALARLPGRIDLVLQDVKKRFRRVMQEMELSEGIPELVTFVDGLKASCGKAAGGSSHAPVTTSNRRRRCSRESRHSSRG